MRINERISMEDVVTQKIQADSIGSDELLSNDECVW